jgi:hypothetical protein
MEFISLLSTMSTMPIVISCQQAQAKEEMFIWLWWIRGWNPSYHSKERIEDDIYDHATFVMDDFLAEINQELAQYLKGSNFEIPRVPATSLFITVLSDKDPMVNLRERPLKFKLRCSTAKSSNTSWN